MSGDKINLEINNRTLSIEISKIGRQADGSAYLRYGDTIMFVSATSKKEMKEPKPFLPLIVDYRENTYAAGKIPGGFFKREGRPSEREILVSRLIDRPIRSLFPDGYFYDTQIVALLLSADLENEPDTLGLIGASAALYFSDIPFTTPLGAVKVGYIDNSFVINPTVKKLEESPLDMVVVGTEEGIVMIEAGAVEMDEEKIIEGISIAQEEIQKIIKAQKDLYDKLKIQKREFSVPEIDASKYEKIEKKISSSLKKAFLIQKKKEKEKETKEILDSLLEPIPEENEDEINETKEIFFQIQKKLVRDLIIKEGIRSDGRGFDDIRPISIDVGILPRTHGSALFTRGETQCLATVTLGTFEDVQRLNGLGEEGEKRFMLHYNFPPFSVGEVAFLRAPGRREIGHGALAEKSILRAIPDEDTFPYTIRIVSDILESNGSSSMATVCGGVLSLMDAGVPLSMIIAGIAIGLVHEDDRYLLLTDIAGPEDHFGDMDLKVAGTEKGITAIQMDLKIPFIPIQVLKEGLLKAKNARTEVLKKMNDALPEPKPDISPYAPRIINLMINPEKVGDVIGPAGKHIKKILAQTNSKIEIEESGKITIAAANIESAEKALQMIREITVEAEVGKVYTGKVVRLEEYGGFVEILPNIVGLLHISEIAHHRVRNIRDVLKMGQTVRVKVLAIDEDNKIKLSKKALEEAPPSSSEFSPDRQKKSPFFQKRYNKDRF
ncbi:MAG: polyribonucleotide nucleotidyltransferase [Candidatus Aminicenantes bacterium]|nr:polyribonucleotide nucleotidyltransferase [Candidatus Aminicenantes bacterium]MDH5705979.1 polyribonucleotide nucleotidyltransferase [Candidatus Aminicenantes bacterium]